nr:PREDICTED: lipid droplet-associated hydrolase isoform X1 [Bemisia tabaci]
MLLHSSSCHILRTEVHQFQTFVVGCCLSTVPAWMSLLSVLHFVCFSQISATMIYASNMTYQEGWVVVNEMPTHVETWGGWIEDPAIKDSKELLICVSGNPGVTEFYSHFLSLIHSTLKIPVWIISHAGHELPPNALHLKYPTVQDKPQLYDLDGQVTHKVQFIEKYAPEKCDLYFIGHSVGAKIMSDIMKNYPHINSRIKKCYMLFPTLEHIANAPNAKFFIPMFTYLNRFILFWAWVSTLLPGRLRNMIINGVMYLSHPSGVTDCCLTATDKLVDPVVVKNVFFLANDEMGKIKDLDTETIEKNLSKLRFYFGTTDGWCPVSYYENLRKKCPQADAILCPSNIKHAFVISSSHDMADLISKWIKEDK